MLETERRVEAMMAAIAAQHTRNAKERLADSSPLPEAKALGEALNGVFRSTPREVQFAIDVFDYVQPVWRCEGSVRAEVKL